MLLIYYFYMISKNDKKRKVLALVALLQNNVFFKTFLNIQVKFTLWRWHYKILMQFFCMKRSSCFCQWVVPFFVEIIDGPRGYLNVIVEYGAIHSCILFQGLTNRLGGAFVELKLAIFTYFGSYLAMLKECEPCYMKTFETAMNWIGEVVTGCEDFIHRGKEL